MATKPTKSDLFDDVAPKATSRTRGRKDVERKAKAQLLALQAGIDPKHLPKELQWSGQAGMAHLRLTEERIHRFFDNFSKVPHVAIAAQATDGRKGTHRTFSDFYKQGKARKSPEAIAFAERWDAAVTEAGGAVVQKAYELVTVGQPKSVASAGEVIAVDHVIDTKLLAQMLKVADPAFAAANKSGGGVQVQINNTVGANPDSNPNDPSFTFRLSETYLLDAIERQQLEAIASKIISNRQSESVTIDLSPDESTREALESPIIIESDDGDNPYDI